MSTPFIYKLKVFETTAELNLAAADFIIDTAKNAIAERGRFTISLSGGTTPEKLYSLLATTDFCDQIEWGKTFVFWGDERCVALGDILNNAGRAFALLFDKIKIPASNIYRIPVNLSPVIAAEKYEEELKLFFNDELIRFDLILLGLGENGHTASLFPGTTVMDENVQGVKSVYVEEEKMFRITMTAPLINQARKILFLVSGEKKAEIIKRVFQDPEERYPAQLIHPVDGELSWFIDEKAASLI